MLSQIADLAFLTFGIALPLVHSWKSRVEGKFSSHWRGYWVVLWGLMVADFLFELNDYRFYQWTRFAVILCVSRPEIKFASGIINLWEHFKANVTSFIDDPERNAVREFPKEMQEIMETEDLDILKKFLYNESTIPIRNIQLHPVASTPKTLGCFCIVQLGMLASELKLPDKELKKLPEFLRAISKHLVSGSDDLKENSIYTLYSLFELSSDIGPAALDAGIFEGLMKNFENPKVDVRLTVSSCCFHLYCENLSIKSKFVIEKGFLPQLELLDTDDELTLFEVSKHLTSLIYVRTDTMIGVSMKAKGMLQAAGIKVKLERALTRIKKNSYLTTTLETCLKEFQE